ncbi:phenylacetate--CoA ligase family protein [Rubrimonas cliftonensis]|uniref:Phenylacetate-CoA ligase n=1 Tax=Rubrimonas cliftonensis TaxID=89524 RepID=A0A1H4EIV5_9RHOB|nr:AMP-binding protein [Rubrimonas cliftonensis]SEA84779.1 phenylacetate-CoA ligase [Rubrimonas cliftonensis]
MSHFDFLEIRDPADRAAEQFAELRRVLEFALDHAPGMLDHLGGVDVDAVINRRALAALPILRKSDLPAMQAADPPFAGLATRAPYHTARIFMSPGPILEPGGDGRDWWRLGRFLHAAGFGMGDIVQNCFAYHLTPAGHMMESAIAAISAACIPAGPGQTEQQVEVASRVGATAYVGTPDFLKIILDRADEMGRKLSIRKAAVSGGALFPSLRQEYADRGVRCLQCYATAELGLVAYESEAMEGMIVDEGVIVEIVRPGTGDPAPDGEVGEVVVTALNADYPLIRFATGDLSAVLPGQSPCGRTNMRIRGWMGRADQTAKIKGMFVRPEQVAAVLARHREALRARITIARDGEKDVFELAVETAHPSEGLAAALGETLHQTVKLHGAVRLVEPGDLPNDGKVIDDQRNYD